MKSPGIGIVGGVSPPGGTNVMENATGGADKVLIPFFAQSKAKVYIFETVDESFVETAFGKKQFPIH